MEYVDFDNVTLNLPEYYLADITGFRNGTTHIGERPNFYNGPLQVTFAGFYSKLLIKCYGLQLKDKDIYDASYIFKSNLFPNGIRPTDGSPLKPASFIHLPNRFLLATSTLKFTWPTRLSNSSYEMVFMLTGGDVVRRRNKRSEPCISDKIDYDQKVINEHVEKVGCKPPYFKGHQNYSICSTIEELRDAVFDVYFIRNKLKKPCTSLQNMNYRYNEVDYTVETITDTSEFHVVLILFDMFKEILQVQAVDIQTVIGNAGGYVGLFCGNDLNSITLISFSIVLLKNE